MKVSVIINCFNGEEFLNETFESLKKQTFQDFEIIFIDNCSSDNSSSLAMSYGDQLNYYKTSTNVTLGKARNIGLEKSTGEYVSYIDVDDVWDNTKLERQVNELDSNSDVGMVFSNFKILNMLKNKINVYQAKAKNRNLAFEELVGNYSFCLSSFMVRKKALNGLDHWFNVEFRYAEEFELFSRIAYNWRTVYLSEPLVTYRIHKNMNTIKLQDRIGIEYGIALENLHKMDVNFEGNYPIVEKRISFFRDFFQAKYYLKIGKNKDVKKIITPYIFYNCRAIFCYFVSFFPVPISKMLMDFFYRKRI